jgi:hypothetical protein
MTLPKRSGMLKGLEYCDHTIFADMSPMMVDLFDNENDPKFRLLKAAFAGLNETVARISLCS